MDADLNTGWSEQKQRAELIKQIDYKYDWSLMEQNPSDETMWCVWLWIFTADSWESCCCVNRCLMNLFTDVTDLRSDCSDDITGNWLYSTLRDRETSIETPDTWRRQQQVHLITVSNTNHWLTAWFIISLLLWWFVACYGLFVVCFDGLFVTEPQTWHGQKNIKLWPQTKYNVHTKYKLIIWI